MSCDKTINIPHGLVGETLKKNVGNVCFKVTADCVFCYSDPTPCFPSFMAAGFYAATTPPTVYGPYTPTAAGTVNYNAVVSSPPPAPPSPCSPTGELTATACSITVDS